MQRITVVFASGAIQEFVVESLTVSRDAFGQLIGLNWEPAKGRKTPMRIKLDNVDGIFYEELVEEQK